MLKIEIELELVQIIKDLDYIKGFFKKTNTTKIALVDDSTTGLDPYGHTNYVIFDLTASETEGTGGESIMIY